MTYLMLLIALLVILLMCGNSEGYRGWYYPWRNWRPLSYRRHRYPYDFYNAYDSYNTYNSYDSYDAYNAYDPYYTGW